ncbi:MAG: PilZ domain-containing protein [Bdellovibrionales bacterium]
MSKILLISRAGLETQTLRRELNRKQQVIVATTPDQAIENIQSDTYHLLVFNTEVFNQKKLSLTSNLRDIGQNFPVLVLANTVMPETFYNVEQMKNTVLLEKPFDVKDLHGLSEKMIDGREVRQRIFRRYQTSQDGEFTKTFASDSAIQIRIRNLSQGGAFFEYEGRPTLTIGDEVQLNIPLNQMQRRYNVKAKVVWSTMTTTIGRYGFGVQFLR